MAKRPDEQQRLLLQRRGYRWRDYVVVKSLYGCVFFRNIHTGRILIINKHN